MQTLQANSTTWRLKEALAAGLLWSRSAARAISSAMRIEETLLKPEEKEIVEICWLPRMRKRAANRKHRAGQDEEN